MHENWKRSGFQQTVLAGTFYSHFKNKNRTYMFPHIIHYYRQEEEIYEMYSLLPTTVTIIKKSTVNAGEGLRKREPSSASAGNGNCYRHRGTEWRFLKILKMQLSCDPAVPHLGYSRIKLKLEKACELQPSLQHHFKSQTCRQPEEVLGEVKGKSGHGTHKQRNVPQPPNRREQSHLQQQRRT